MKTYVGMAKAVPDSRTPRRFIAISTMTSDDRDRRLVAVAAKASAEAAFCDADEIDTATVST